MKKLLSLVLVTFMAMSMFVITASADDGFYPVDAGTFQLIGDWDFEEATIAENLTIPEQTDGGTVTYANGGITFNEVEGGILPAVEFLSSKMTATPIASDYVYYEFTVDFREAAEFGDFRLTIYNSQPRDTGFIGISSDTISFRGRTSSGALLEVGAVDYVVTDEESLTKIGMLVNLSEKYYAGYINGEMVCEQTFTDYTMRTGYLTGSVQFTNMNTPAGADNKITFYDYKFYKGVTPDPVYPYTKVKSWDMAADATVTGGTDGTYTTTTTDGLNIAMTADGAFPSVTLAAKNPGGTFTTDMYYYEFVLNSGSLKTGAYTITFTGKAGSASKTFYTVDVYKDQLFLKRGNSGWSTTVDIPAEIQGTDMKFGILIDQNDPNGGYDNSGYPKGYSYVYLNRELVAKCGNNDRSKYHPFAQAITIADNATVTKTAGEAIVIKSLDVYWCAETAVIQESIIPTEGAFSATASYNVDSIAAADGQVTATVTLTKEGNAGWYNKDVVFVASYAANGSLLEVVKADGFVKGGQTTTITKTVKTEVGGQVRVFLWDDMKTLVPVETFSPLQ